MQRTSQLLSRTIDRWLINQSINRLITASIDRPLPGPRRPTRWTSAQLWRRDCRVTLSIPWLGKVGFEQQIRDPRGTATARDCDCPCRCPRRPPPVRSRVPAPSWDWAVSPSDGDCRTTRAPLPSPSGDWRKYWRSRRRSVWGSAWTPAPANSEYSFQF